MVQNAKELKQKLKTHVGMARGPARRRVRQDSCMSTALYEVRQRYAETRMPSRAHRL